MTADNLLFICRYLPNRRYRGGIYLAITGIAPFAYSSDTSVRGRTKVSKMGARQVKADLTQAACSAVQHDPEMAANYARKKAEGKHHGSVMNAVKFKLVERVFTVIREQRKYIKIDEYLTFKIGV